MEENPKNEAEFYLKVQVKNPRKNAPEYKITTIQELFDILTEENLPRFIKDFKVGMQTSIAMRDLVKALAEQSGEEVPADFLQMPYFTWIDDRKK